MWSEFVFFFNDTATTEIYTLSLHDALPICGCCPSARSLAPCGSRCARWLGRSRSKSRWLWMMVERRPIARCSRSEEHTSELQSRQYLVCRLLLEKKNNSKQTSVFHPRPSPV